MPSEDSASPAKDIGALIPTVYYDLIARVSAGIPFAFGLVYLINPIWATDGLPRYLEKPTFVIFLVFAGYLAGLLLGSCSVLLEIPVAYWLMLCCDHRFRSFRRFQEDRFKCVDQVGMANREWGATVVKMMAETDLCQNLLIGSAIFLVMKWLMGQNYGPVWPIYRNTLVVILIFVTLYRATAAYFRLKSYCAEIVVENVAEQLRRTKDVSYSGV